MQQDIRTPRVNKIEDLEQLVPLDINRIQAGYIVHGDNSPYAKIIGDIRIFQQEGLNPIVLYYEPTDEILVTSNEYMQRKFH